MKYLKLFENFIPNDLEINVLKLFLSGSHELAELTAQSIGTTLTEILNKVLNQWMNGYEGGYDFNFKITVVPYVLTEVDNGYLYFSVEIEKGSMVEMTDGESVILEKALENEYYGWMVRSEISDIIRETANEKLKEVVGDIEKVDIEIDIENYKFVDK